MWFELGDEIANCAPQGVDCVFCPGTQQCLEFRKRHLDRVEVGTVGRQIAQLGTGTFDGFPDAGSLNRLHAMYMDKFDGRNDDTFYDRMSAQ